jgi:hypothetical protein
MLIYLEKFAILGGVLMIILGFFMYELIQKRKKK